jgi:nucleoid-associated protein YgaU
MQYNSLVFPCPRAGFGKQMKIFLSYPSSHKEAAASINYELHAAGHDVFFDKEDLPPGQSYNEKIRSAIEASDLFLFLITPQSVTQGQYTLTELKIASRRWPRPAGHVLPVMLEPTPFDKIPAYPKAVTILIPEGNVAAEILMEVAALEAAPRSEKKLDVTEDREIESYTYRSVEIRFGSGSAGSYPVAITASSVGGMAAQPCVLDTDAWISQLWTSGIAIQGAARRGNIDTGAGTLNLMPSEEAARAVGQRLYESLFNPQMRPHLQENLRLVDPQCREGLRFLINTTDAPELAQLPWEFLYDPKQDDFLFSDKMKPVIRWLDVDQPAPTLVIKPPLRLLVAIAAPKDVPQLSIGAELSRLDGALQDLIAQGRVIATRLEHATLDRLDDALLRHKPHLLHFIGHGDFIGDDGVIFLETEGDDAADPITGRRLAVLLRNHLGSLRFVFLNSCLGATASRRDPFGGVAQNLIRRGIPAVIAMQFPIPDTAALALARSFYRYLAAGQPVDTALTSARAVLFARGYPVEWGAPTLHMRTPDGRLFDVGTTDQQPEPLPAAAPAADPIETRGKALSSAQQASTKAAPSRRWLWASLALVLAITALAAVGWLFSDKLSVAPPAVDTPGLPTSQVPTVPPSIVDKHHQAALKALREGNAAAALRNLEEAQRMDPAGAALAASPELRQALFDELLASLRKELDAGNLETARQVAAALLQIDKDRATQELRSLFPAAGRDPASAAETYRVKTGESLWTIAAAQFGDPLQWPLIYQANRDRIKDPDLIYPDMELVIPSGLLSEGKRRYLVKSGDTLWTIAGSVYGDPLLWRRIYDANRDRLEDPALIRPGQQLVIPWPGGRSQQPAAGNQ